LGSHGRKPQTCGRLIVSKKGGNMLVGGYRPFRGGFHNRYKWLPTSIEGSNKFWTNLRAGTTTLVANFGKL
jgi:hypothetical protein